MNHLKLVRKKICVFILLSAHVLWAEDTNLNFDEFLDKTEYAVLLKELIGLTDTIGLLSCRMDKSERRFVEDSILGKVVRAEYLLKGIQPALLGEDEREYLEYWVRLAKVEDLPQLVYDQITRLEESFYQSCQNGCGAEL